MSLSLTIECFVSSAFSKSRWVAWSSLQKRFLRSSVAIPVARGHESELKVRVRGWQGEISLRWRDAHAVEGMGEWG